jgi:ferrous iron transport protein B
VTAAPKLAPPALPEAPRAISVAVAGNPNSGKSTLINAIAGTRLQVGNWPGVTVEKKAAALEHAGRRLRLVDLPGRRRRSSRATSSPTSARTSS